MGTDVKGLSQDGRFYLAWHKIFHPSHVTEYIGDGSPRVCWMMLQGIVLVHFTVYIFKHQYRLIVVVDVHLILNYIDLSS